MGWDMTQDLEVDVVVLNPILTTSHPVDLYSHVYIVLDVGMHRTSLGSLPSLQLLLGSGLDATPSGDWTLRNMASPKARLVSRALHKHRCIA